MIIKRKFKFQVLKPRDTLDEIKNRMRLQSRRLPSSHLSQSTELSHCLVSSHHESAVQEGALSFCKEIHQKRETWIVIQIKNMSPSSVLNLDLLKIAFFRFVFFFCQILIYV